MIEALERTIAAISPSWALAREQHRQALTIVRGPSSYFDAARRDRHTDRWRRPATGPNAEALPALTAVRAAVRELERNNAHARRAPSVISANAVGAGIVGRLTGSERALKRAQPIVEEWFNSTQCDADGRTNFWGLQEGAVREMASGGEAIIRRRRRRPTDGLAIPLQLQVLEGDWLDHSRDGELPNGHVVVQGVEHDALGRRVAYWLFDAHPGERTPVRMGESRPVPADQIAHLYRLDRRGQVRGIPWGAPVVMAVRDFADFKRGQLQRQKIAAAFAGIVEAPAGPVAGGITLGTQEAGPRGDILEIVRPGTFQYLRPGEKVTFPDPPQLGDFGEYSRVTLGEVAAGYEIPYESLTGDLTGVNFSSGRMGWLGFQRSIDVWRWNIIVPQMLDVVFRWMRETMLIMGLPSDLGCEWSPPHREMIQPKEEIAAMTAQRRLGIVSTSELIRRTGYDPKAVRAEIAADQEEEKRLGILTDGNPADDAKRGSGAPPDDPDAPANDDDPEPEPKSA